MNSVIEVKAASKVFDGPVPVRALDDVDLAVSEGEFIVITGPSGSGKSTLLNLLGCLDRPTSGSYELSGQDVSGMSDRELSSVRGRVTGMVFQTFHLVARQRVIDNVAMASLYQWETMKQARQSAWLALGKVGIQNRALFHPSVLSGGERQRVAIARAIAHEPRVLLADEPTGNLDTANSQLIVDVFKQLWADGMTVIIVTHDLNIAGVAQRHIQLEDGRVISGQHREGETV